MSVGICMHILCVSVQFSDFVLMFFSLCFSLRRGGGSEGVESKAADFPSQNTGFSVLQVHPVEKGCCCQSFVAVGSLP